MTLSPLVEVAAQNPETQTMIIAETATLLAASLGLGNQAGLFLWSCVWLTNKGSTNGLNHDAAASATHFLGGIYWVFAQPSVSVLGREGACKQIHAPNSGGIIC